MEWKKKRAKKVWKRKNKKVVIYSGGVVGEKKIIEDIKSVNECEELASLRDSRVCWVGGVKLVQQSFSLGN